MKSKMTCANISFSSAAPNVLKPSSKNFARKPTSKSTILSKPVIAITLGDPAGIGPEIVAKAVRDKRVKAACHPILLGHAASVPMGKPSKVGGQIAIEALAQGLELVRSGLASALVTAPVSKEAFRLARHGFPGHTEWLAERCKAPDAAMLMVSGPLRAILLTRHVPIKE